MARSCAAFTAIEKELQRLLGKKTMEVEVVREAVGMVEQ